MQLTKYEHACFTVQSDERRLVLDPGNLTTDLDIQDKTDVVVITHEHPDHFLLDNISQIVKLNPATTVVGPQAVVDGLSELDCQTQVAAAGDNLTIGNFSLEFFGGTHAEIHSDIPLISNLAVLINQTLYYPGDSLTRPDKSVTALALPAAAPWLKIGESIDLLRDIKPKIAFPTHDAIYSESGKNIADNMLSGAAESIDCQYTRLESGESITV
ncbi:MAG: MBL fold metallo-hydrolase [bacterium]|nr:MBL fold metallo-hydrolase [bacterium]